MKKLFKPSVYFSLIPAKIQAKRSFALRVLFAFCMVGLIGFSCGPDQSRESNAPFSTIKIFIGDHAQLLFDGLRALPSNYSPPSSVSGFNCLAVNVMGKDIPSQSKNDSVDTILTNLLNGSSYCSYPGVIGFADASDNSVTLQIPAGAKRVIQMVGISDLYNSKICQTKVIPIDNPSSTATPTPTSTSSSSPLFYEVGRTVTDLYSSQAVNIRNSYDSLSAADKLGRLMNKCTNCPSTMQYDVTTDRCVCLQGTAYNSSTQSCNACPSDTTYDATNFSCKCAPQGSFFNPSTFACGCSNGGTYNAAKKTCDCPSNSTASAAGICTTNCPSGTVFDPTTSTCKTTTTASPSPGVSACGAGLVFNPLTSQCSACPTGSTYLAAGSTCSCPGGTAQNGTVYSSVFSQSTFKCFCTIPAGSSFAQELVGSQSSPCVCPNGLTLINGACTVPTAESNYKTLILSEASLLSYYPLNEGFSHRC